MNVTGGALHLSATGNDLTRAQLNFADPAGKDTLQADVVLDGAHSGDASQAFVRLAGGFYSALPTPVGQTGSVFAEIMIGERAGNLQAWYQITQSTNADFTEETVITEGTLLDVVSLGLSYRLSLKWNGDNQIMFGVDSIEVCVDGPPMQAPISVPFRHVAAGIADDLTQVGSASVAATIDNVAVNGMAYDDFADDALDTTLWSSRQEHSIALDTGAVRLTAQSDDGATSSARMFLQDEDAHYLQADVTLHGDSAVGGTDGQVRGRIVGYFYNDRRDGNPAGAGAYDGDTGEVLVQVTVRERDSGAFQSFCHIFACGDAACSDPAGTEVMFQNFTTAVTEDVAYTLSIELTDDGRIVCMLDDEAIEHVIATPVYPSGAPYKGLQARAQGAPGTAVALFDNIYTDNEQPIADAGADQAVDAGDTVYLTGAGADSDSEIVASVWTQTQGTPILDPVVFPTASGVGVTSFEAPGVNEDLVFQLTVWDDHGGSATDTVTVSVSESDRGHAGRKSRRWRSRCHHARCKSVWPRGHRHAPHNRARY